MERVIWDKKTVWLVIYGRKESCPVQKKREIGDRS